VPPQRPNLKQSLPRKNGGKQPPKAAPNAGPRLTVPAETELAHNGKAKNSPRRPKGKSGQFFKIILNFLPLMLNYGIFTQSLIAGVLNRYQTNSAHPGKHDLIQNIRAPGLVFHLLARYRTRSG
jgi:hypothetical protein